MSGEANDIQCLGAPMMPRETCLSVSGPYYPLCWSSSQTGCPQTVEGGCRPPHCGFTSTWQDIPIGDSASLLISMGATVLGFNVTGPGWSHVPTSNQSLWLGKVCILIGQAWVVCPALELQGLSVGEGWFSRGSLRVLSPAGGSVWEAGRSNR